MNVMPDFIPNRDWEPPTKVMALVTMMLDGKVRAKLSRTDVCF